MIQEQYRVTLLVCRIRKVNAKDMKDNEKDFYRSICSKRKSREKYGPTTEYGRGHIQ